MHHFVIAGEPFSRNDHSIQKGWHHMAVSFSGAAKAEICRVFPNRDCCALAECFGILLYCNSFTADSIKIITESRALQLCIVTAMQRNAPCTTPLTKAQRNTHPKPTYDVYPKVLT